MTATQRAVSPLMGACNYSFAGIFAGSIRSIAPPAFALLLALVPEPLPEVRIIKDGTRCFRRLDKYVVAARMQEIFLIEIDIVIYVVLIDISVDSKRVVFMFIRVKFKFIEEVEAERVV